ncbi:BON domain-containing protein [Methylococcaceae bacterium CS1]|nr:BON domain-containing protein [Methyloprofundus sp.]TXK98425.1 BON domain-containing protein [Methylococcaceae bacterium CS4]TXL00984.1 BON domain-containing protein [Methylococcaceae bacterium CS5]TXL07047.1 BON domain-containing protein [Methylococcaceae bacterium CS1]TXL08330.1 BON domain-containing protein [Methylococcaceae bacterium CS3]TXL11107.1 BON domain-containing protein [Methylococcaceae bacterium CS2]
MKQSLILICVLMLTACGSIGQGLAEITGFSFLHDRRDSAAITLDEKIEDSAIIELHGLDEIKGKSHFNITSYNGKVLITGEAETEDIREIIIANVRIISGVKLVHNEMALGPVSTLGARSEDSMLTIKVKDALSQIKDKPGFDATRVKVVTENKVVYLMGLVHKEEGEAAAKAVQNVAKVKKIVTVFEYIDYASEN